MVTDQNIDIIYYPGMSRIPVCITEPKYRMGSTTPQPLSQFYAHNTQLKTPANNHKLNFMTI